MYNEELNGETKTLPENFWKSSAVEIIHSNLSPPWWWDSLEPYLTAREAAGDVAVA